MKKQMIYLLIALALVSCSKERDNNAAPVLDAVESVAFASKVEQLVAPVTKSAYISSSFDDEKITGITIAVYDHSTGRLYDKRHFNYGFDNMEIELRGGVTYDLYALANMGNQTAAVPVNRAALLSSFAYTVPSYSDVNTRGIPMSARIENYTAGTAADNCFNLHRLFAKVTLNVLTTYNGGTDEGVKVTNLKIGNGNGVLKAFGASALTVASNRLPEEDYQTNSSVNATSVVFYVPENRNGTIGSATTSRNKNPDANAAVAAVSDLLTYAEVTVTAASTYYTGTVYYRSYVGINATDNFDVRGNCAYIWNMTLTEDGLVYDDWKIDNSLADGRYLYFLQDPVLVQAGEEVSWNDILDTNLNWGDINKSYGGVSIFEDTPDTAGFTVVSDVEAGDTMSVLFAPSRNYRATLEDETHFIVYERYLMFDREVYAANPRGSVVSDISYGDTYHGDTVGLGGFTSGDGVEWTVTIPEVPGNTDNAKLTYIYNSTNDRITWSPTKYAFPGDYPFSVYSADGSLEDEAILRVNETRWINTNRAGSGNLNRTTNMAFNASARTWNIEFAFGDKSNSNDNTNTWRSSNFGYYAGSRMTRSNWTNHIGFELVANAGLGNRTASYTATTSSATGSATVSYNVPVNTPMGTYKLMIYWIENPAIRDSAILNVTGNMVTGIEIPESLSVRRGSNTSFPVRIWPANATYPNISFVFVDGNGTGTINYTGSQDYLGNDVYRFNGNENGMAHIKVVAGDGSGVESNLMEVTVYDMPVSISAVPSTATVDVGEDMPVTVYANYSDYSRSDITADCSWSFYPTDAGVISYDHSRSTVTGIEYGGPQRIHFTYEAGGQTFGCDSYITVAGETAPEHRLLIEDAPFTINVGESIQPLLVRYQTRYAGGGWDQGIIVSATWNSADDSIASVTYESGGWRLNGVSAGGTTITASYADLTVDADVTVSDNNGTALILPSPILLEVGDTFQFQQGEIQYIVTVNGVEVVHEYPSPEEIADWGVSGGGSCVTIDENGVITAQTAGTVYIHGRYDDTIHGYGYAIGVCRIVVTDPATPPVFTYELVVTPETATVSVGGTQQFTATLYTRIDGVSDGGQTVPASWSITSGEGYATIDSSGLATGVDLGDVTVKATYNNDPSISATAMLHVDDSFNVDPGTGGTGSGGGNY
jgi:hypothetical protein